MCLSASSGMSASMKASQSYDDGERGQLRGDKSQRNESGAFTTHIMMKIRCVTLDALIGLVSSLERKLSLLL